MPLCDRRERCLLTSGWRFTQCSTRSGCFRDGHSTTCRILSSTYALISLGRSKTRGGNKVELSALPSWPRARPKRHFAFV